MMIHTITRKYEIIMGHEGETGYRTVAFDVSMFPEDAVVFLDYVRYGEHVPYPINLERKGSVAYWYPNEIDTAFRGTGRGQLVCMRGDELIGKSDVFKLINRFSLSHVEEAPSGYENWLQELERIAASVVSGVDAGKAEIDAEIESGKAEINRTSAEAVESINTAKTEAVNTVNSAKNDGINRLNDRIESGKAEINTAKTTALDSIESKKEAVHTELDHYVEAHHDELKGERGDAYVVTEEDLKEIGDRVEAEYEPNLNALKEEVSHKAEATDLATANRKIKALTDVLNGKELAFETNEYESARVEVLSGAVADSILEIGGKSITTRNEFELGSLVDFGSLVDGICRSTASTATYGNLIRPLNSKARDISSGRYYISFDLRLVSGTIQRINTVSLMNESNDGLNTSASVSGVTVPTISEQWQRFVYSVDVSYGGKLRKVYLQSYNTSNAVVEIKDIVVSKEITEYEPYFEGIRSSQVDAVGVRGANLFDEEWELGYFSNTAEPVISTGSIRSKNFIEVEPNTTYSLVGEDVVIVKYKSDKKPSGWGNASFIIWRASNMKFTTDSETKYIKIALPERTSYTKGVAIIKGSTETYIPYSYKEIPTNLPILRSAGSVSDSIEGGKLVRRVGVYTFTGNEQLRDEDIYGVYDGLATRIGAKGSTNAIITNGLIPISTGIGSISNTILIGSSGNISVNVNNTSSEIVSAMRGATMCFELAEPIIEDIDPMPQLEAINVEAGGEVSFIDHSDMSFPIPSTHEWVVRNSEV